MKNKNTKAPAIRNLIAAEMTGKSKRFIGRGTRRAKDARKSWRNEEY